MIRMIFSTVCGPQDPAFTVGSFAITATGRPWIEPTPVTTPSAGRSPASALTSRPFSANPSASSSSSRRRSRTNSLPCSASFSWYFGAPPARARSAAPASASACPPSGPPCPPSGSPCPPCGPPCPPCTGSSLTIPKCSPADLALRRRGVLSPDPLNRQNATNVQPGPRHPAAPPPFADPRGAAAPPCRAPAGDRRDRKGPVRAEDRRRRRPHHRGHGHARRLEGRNHVRRLGPPDGRGEGPRTLPLRPGGPPAGGGGRRRRAVVDPEDGDHRCRRRIRVRPPARAHRQVPGLPAEDRHLQAGDERGHPGAGGGAGHAIRAGPARPRRLVRLAHRGGA